MQVQTGTDHPQPIATSPVQLDTYAQVIGPVQPIIVDQPKQSSNDELDNTTIEARDEHRRHIIGTSQACMMCVENPENFRHIVCSTSITIRAWCMQGFAMQQYYPTLNMSSTEGLYFSHSVF